MILWEMTFWYWISFLRFLQNNEKDENFLVLILKYTCSLCYFLYLFFFFFFLSFLFFSGYHSLQIYYMIILDAKEWCYLLIIEASILYLILFLFACVSALEKLLKGYAGRYATGDEAQLVCLPIPLFLSSYNMKSMPLIAFCISLSIKPLL